MWLGRKRIRGGVLSESGGFARCRGSLRGRELRFEWPLMVILTGNGEIRRVDVTAMDTLQRDAICFELRGKEPRAKGT